MDKKLKKIIISALFAALTFCATFVIKIPTPTGGYVHLGDSIVLLSGWLLGPVFGTLSAALGSALSDLLGGYPTYILPTFVIKGLMALLAWCFLKLLPKKNFVFTAVSGIVGCIVMVAGYYLVEATFLGYGFAGALASVVPNIVQGVFGAVSAALLAKLFDTNKTLRGFIEKERK